MGLDEALREARYALGDYGMAAFHYATDQHAGAAMDAAFGRFERALDALVAAARADRPLSHEAVAAMEAG